MTHSPAVSTYPMPATLSLFLPDEQATATLGAALADCVMPGLTLYLNGELGAGKTALVRALLRGLGHQGPVKSPTYALMESYTVSTPGMPASATGAKESWQLRHFDLYRLSDPREFADVGFREEFNGETLCLVEWPQHGAGVLPSPDIDITLSYQDEGRAVTLSALSEKGSTCINHLKSHRQP